MDGKMSNQIVETPKEFIDAVKDRFGAISWDLAATANNAQAFGFFGPGSGVAQNAFMAQWDGLGPLAWLNPPFADIEPWACKCAESVVKYRQRIAMLIPAAVCTAYFIKYVIPYAYVFELTPRVFKKEIRDCCLALYEPAGYKGRETWRWK